MGGELVLGVLSANIYITVLVYPLFRSPPWFLELPSSVPNEPLTSAHIRKGETICMPLVQYGLSAAVGKAGAAIGTEAFTPIQDNLGKKWTFIIAAICGVVGVLVTWFFVPDISGEDLKYRDEQFRAYLVAHGWDGEMGEDDLKAIADQGIPPAVTEGGREDSCQCQREGMMI